MKNDFLLAITQLTAEKSLPQDVVFEAVESALAAAYKRDYNLLGLIHVKIDRDTGEIHVESEREVVEVEEDIADDDQQVDLDTARQAQPTIQIGDTLRLEHHVGPAGRIAAQTAKQVVLQRLREAEREVVYEEYAGQEGDVVSGIIQRVEPRQVILDLGRTEALLPQSEQVRMEHYRPGQRLRVYVVEVLKSNKGPQVVVSRTHRDLIRRLFELEVPEIFKGQAEIKAIAREPGHRTKVAVHSRVEGLDPVGACVGMRGMRIQNIVNELQGERVDVIQWDPEPRKFVAHALSPAQVMAARIDYATNTAELAVPDRQMSLAIGKEGQNARLAARLTGLRIDIKPQSLAEELKEQGLGPYAPQAAAPPLTPAAAAVMAPAPTPEAAAPVSGAEVVAPAPERAARVAGPERAEIPEIEEEEEELEPVLAVVEVAPSPTEPGKIRFAEEVLVRREAEDSSRKKRKKRGARFIESEDGLEADPYADYQEEYVE